MSIKRTDIIESCKGFGDTAWRLPISRQPINKYREVCLSVIKYHNRGIDKFYSSYMRCHSDQTMGTAHNLLAWLRQVTTYCFVVSQ